MKPYAQGGFQNSGEKIIRRFAEADRLEAGGLSPIGGKLTPHPEGGHYRQTWIADASDGKRPAGTCIYFLLKAGEVSRWHRVDAVEIWHYYAGAPLILSMAETEAGPARDYTLGPDVLAGETPQLIVPTHHWQAARSTGDYTLVGCTVSPAFHFDGFEMMDEGGDIPYS